MDSAGRSLRGNSRSEAKRRRMAAIAADSDEGGAGDEDSDAADEAGTEDEDSSDDEDEYDEDEDDEDDEDEDDEDEDDEDNESSVLWSDRGGSGSRSKRPESDAMLTTGGKTSDASETDHPPPPALPFLMPFLHGLGASAAPHSGRPVPPPPPPRPPSSAAPPPPLRVKISSAQPPAAPPSKKKSQSRQRDAAQPSEATSITAGTVAGGREEVGEDVDAGAGEADAISIPLHCGLRVQVEGGAAHLLNAGAAVWATSWLPDPPPGALPTLAVGTFRNGAGHTLMTGHNAILLWELPSRADDTPSAAEATSAGGTEADQDHGPRDAGVRGPWLQVMHDGGGVLALSWCPSGNACPAPASGDVQPSVDRLGLLAAACADGRVRIFAIPTRASLEAVEQKLAHPIRPASDRVRTGAAGLWLPPVLSMEPIAPVLTLSLDWCATSTEWLAAGLDDGLVVVWDVTAAPQRPTPGSCRMRGGTRSTWIRRCQTRRRCGGAAPLHQVRL